MSRASSVGHNVIPASKGPAPERPVDCYGVHAEQPLCLNNDMPDDSPSTSPSRSLSTIFKASSTFSTSSKISRTSHAGDLETSPNMTPFDNLDSQMQILHRHTSDPGSSPNRTPFDNLDSQVQILRRQIEATESQLHSLRTQLEKAERDAQEARDVDAAYRGGIAAGWIDETLQVLQQYEQGDMIRRILFESQDSSSCSSPPPSMTRRRWPLETQEYSRYGRQLIMPEIGLFGQLKLKSAKVLVVGLGGLGCPAAAYLAGAGVGTLGLMDGDKVEASNLHRQIAHSTLRIDLSKVDSAHEYLQALNPRVVYNRHRFHLTPDRAIQTVEQYDLVVDCTDHPTSRYLISDACVLTGRPLVTASALKTEGQLMVLNNPPRPPGDALGGPCYRCIFPKPPPPDSVLSCGEGGILGPVVGVMGVLQALEAIKVITGTASMNASSPGPPDTPVSNLTHAGASLNEPDKQPTLTMFSAYSSPQFRTVRLRARRPDGCAVCSGLGTITRESMLSGSLDYVAFCGMTSPINVLPPEARISASDFADLRPDGTHVLIDVRDETQFTICALRGSLNVPWTGDGDTWLQQAAMRGALNEDGKQRYVVCRLGNDSQLAARAMMDRMGTSFNIMDIRGGFRAWREEVDNEWPDY